MLKCGRRELQVPQKSKFDMNQFNLMHTNQNLMLTKTADKKMQLIMNPSL